MTELDDALVPEIYALVQDFGKDLVFQVRAAVGDPTTGAVTGTVTEYTVRCTPPAEVDTRYVDGSTIRRGDMQVVVPAKGLAFEPAPAQKVVVDGRAATVIGVSPIYSGFVVAAWRVYMRR